MLLAPQPGRLLYPTLLLSPVSIFSAVSPLHGKPWGFSRKMAREHALKWCVCSNHPSCPWNCCWHAEGKPCITLIRNEVDSILVQVAVLLLQHWEAALMPRLVWEGSGEAGWGLVAGPGKETADKFCAARGSFYSTTQVCPCDSAPWTSLAKKLRVLGKCETSLPLRWDLPSDAS